MSGSVNLTTFSSIAEKDRIDGEFISILASLDDLVRPRQHVRRNRQANLLGRFKIDDELKLCRLFYRKIGWFRAFVNFIDVSSGRNMATISAA